MTKICTDCKRKLTGNEIKPYAFTKESIGYCFWVNCPHPNCGSTLVIVFFRTQKSIDRMRERQLKEAA